MLIGRVWFKSTNGSKIVFIWFFRDLGGRSLHKWAAFLYLRSMKIQITIPAQSIEVELDAVGTDPVIVDPPPPPVPSTGFKVGVNGFPWFPHRLLDSIGMKWVRCYMASGWAWRPGGLFIQPLFQAETEEAHGMDDYLTKAKSLGINVLLTCHQTPEWFRNTGRGDGNNDFAPIEKGLPRDNPASYAEYASFLFQVAARYGRVKHADSALRVDTTPRWSGDIPNVKKSGLGLLTHLECWNEPDKFWVKGTEAYFEPEEAAAMMSACYDGHEGKLGVGVGIKAADPSMQVVMPALTDYDLPYIAKMEAWFAANRTDKAWPCDLFSIHHYSNRGNKKGQHPAQWVESGACLPKDDANFGTIADIVAFAATINKKVWVSEFGADRNAPSMMHSKGVGKTDAQFQAEIIIKSIEAYKAAGVDAVFVFNGCDENSGADGGQFESCGLFTSQADGYKPTPASEALRAYLKPSQAAQRNIAKPSQLPKMSSGKRPIK